MNGVQAKIIRQVIVFFLMVGAIDCLAQAFGTTKGYNALINSQRRAQIRDEENNKATKLSLSGSQDTAQNQGDSLDFETLKIGDTGNLSYWRFIVQGVLDKTNCVISIGRNSSKRSFVLSEYPTENLVDDMNVFLVDDIKVCGTRMVDTRKYLVLKFQLPRTKRNQKNTDVNNDEPPASEANNGQDPDTRLWSDDTGSYQISAKFIDFKNDNVILEREQQQMEIPLSKICSKDQAYVLGEMQRRKSQPKLKVPTTYKGPTQKSKTPTQKNKGRVFR